MDHIRLRKALNQCQSNEKDYANIVSLVDHWFYSCITRHPGCYFDALPKRSSELPQRLVSLSEFSASAAPSQLRVVNTAGLPNQYAALSYVWRSSNCPIVPFILTRKNQMYLYKGFSTGNVCQCVVDACRLAKGLGFRYVWVDALVSLLEGQSSSHADNLKCVLQDCEEDWERESMNMASIYMNAAVTIAMIDGSGLHDAKSNLQTSLTMGDRLQAQLEPDGTSSQEKIYEALDKSGNFVSRPNGQWDMRGWTFQEKMLSRRIVSITSKGIFWDCLHHSASDRRPTGILGDFSPGFREGDDRAFKKLIQGHSSRMLSSVSVPRWEVYWQWRRAIQDYTSRHLSQQGDRLLAINGLVTRFAVILDDVCVLGIWRGDIIRSLLWFKEKSPSGSGQAMSGQVDLDAPSWTWASVDGPVNYRLRHPWLPYKDTKGEEFTAIASVRVSSITNQDRAMSLSRLISYDEYIHQSSRMQQLSIRGGIRRGWLFAGRIYLDKEPLKPLPGNQASGALSIEALQDQISRLPGDQRRFRGTEFLADDRNFDMDYRKVVSEAACDEVTCLLMAEGGYSQVLTAQFYLVLRQIAVPKHQALFRRIGICSFDRKVICQSSGTHSLSAASSSDHTRCPCLHYITEVQIV